jgi:pyridoxal phosphate enzyme (YggS family)
MDFAPVARNLAQIREEIARVQAAEGLRNDVSIVAVTKGHPAAAVVAAADVGLQDIGENRVQEALEKRTELTDVQVRWHLIGHLQTNKARHVPGNFSVVHSVDSLRVAEALVTAQRRASEQSESGLENTLTVLLQVNVSGESQKSGCAPDEVSQLAHQVSRLPGLQLQGLMTMAPFTGEERVQREVFCRLRLLRDHLHAEGFHVPELSMGMSGDYKAAVAEGATLVRLGTVLFGERHR